MKTMETGGLRISRLSLGTVQLGLNYGIANYRNPDAAGKPPYERARDIVARAAEAGITCLDTAQAYGDSELVLARVLDDLRLRDQMTVVTKIGLGTYPDAGKEREALVEAALRRSLERLKTDVLDICLLHHGDTEIGLIDALVACRERGLTRKIGVSTATPQGALRALDTGVVEAMQLPLNMLDRRFRDAGVFRRARESGVILFTRSVFLQGLLVMPVAKIIPELREVIPVRRALGQWADEAGMDMPELAMRFVMGIEGVSSILVGVDTPQQLDANAAIARKGPLAPERMEELERLIPRLSDYLLDPPQWPNAKGND